MKVKPAIIAVILFQIVVQFGKAQNNDIKFNLVENNKGETLQKITGITQDPHGYMWFAGQGAECLYQYDGTRLISFRNDPLNPNSPGGTNLETVYADDSGMIWMGFKEKGMDQYNPATGIFKHYRNEPNDPGSLSNNTVNVILRDHKGKLWVGTQGGGLDCLDEKTGKFIHYRNEPANPASLSCNIVRAIYEDHKGIIWISTGYPFDNKPVEGGLNLLEPDGTFTRFLNDPKNPHSLINNKVVAIYEDSRGIFWIGTAGDGLHTMNREKGSFERHLYNPAKPDQLSRPPSKKELLFDPITFICEDGSGAIWIGTYASGISRYDTLTKKITHYESGSGFPDGSGWKAFTSRDGVLWFSTQRNNLFRVDPFRKNIYHIATGDPVLCFHEDKKGFLWIGMDEKGLQLYDEMKILIPKLKNGTSDSFSLFNNEVHTLFQNQDDSIWLGTQKGIGIFNKVTGHLSRFRLGTKSDSLFNNGSGSIVEDKQGLIWFATAGGLIKYNPGDGSIKKYYPDSKDPGTISSNIIRTVSEDKSGDIWAGAWWGGGINRLNRQTNRFRHYLAGFDITYLYQDSEGTIWAGTKKGLYRYSKNSDNFLTYFDPKSEINTLQIKGIVEDDVKNLWVSTPSAIIKLDSARKEKFIYDKRFGITPYTLTEGIYKTRRGEILIGYDNGFYAFYPKDLVAKTQPFKIIITNFLINSLSKLPGKVSPLLKPFEEISEITLQYNQNNIAFNFAAIDYRSPETNKYFSMLENYDNTWREAVGEKSSFYLNVPPGKYVFRVKALNSDGASAEKAIQIIINPPWWKTWWAYCVYGLLLLAAIYRIDRFQKQRTIRAEREKAQAKELAQAKEIEKAYTELKSTQALLLQSEKMASLGELTAGIAHEIQNPLNFVNNFSEVNTELIDEAGQEIEKGNIDEVKNILTDIKENEQKINHHGKRADAIVKGMLQHSRISSGVKEPTDINKLADEYLRLAYHGLRAKDKSFNATMKTDFDKSIGNINIIPQDIGRVIINLITNAFYVVNEKKNQGIENYEPSVTVMTSKNPPSGGRGAEVLISVKDNGPGIPKKILDKIFQPFFTTKPTGQGTGLGLSLSYDIVKAHGGELKVETKEGEGSEFIIQLPVV